MACQDCLLNCPDIISDRCVQYTGPEIPLLGVCPGDTLYEFEVAIANEVVGILNGTGIEPAEVTIDCAFLTTILAGASPTLSNLLQMLITASCTLKTLVDTINSEIANGVFNTSCLIGLPTNPTRDDILQAAVNMICSIKVTVDAIPTTYVKNSDLTTLVTQIVNNINGGGGTVVQNSTKMLPYSAVAYFGPTSNFDAGGIGIASLGFSKVYVCNGANGTPDLRGRVIVGAVRSVPGGGALDAAVDPGVNANNPNWGLNDKGGANFVVLSVAEMPTHSHGVNDPGHIHQSRYRQNMAPQSGSSTQCWANLNDQFIATTSAFTGITLQNTGGGQPHNNIQPTIAAWYIMYIP